MGEYSKYTVTDLTGMTVTDDEKSMDSIATGWVNTGAVLGTAKDALKERLEQLKAVWTAPSFAVFEQFINRTIANVEAAQTQADNRADAASKIAKTAGWAKDRVMEQYQEYLQAKLQSNGDSTETSVLKTIGGSVGGAPGTVIGGIASATNDPPTDSEIRAPYDKQARKIMKIALEDYEQNKPAMIQDVVPFRPIREPDHWSNGQDSWDGDGGSGSNNSDTAALSAVSYGGNALGSHSEPSLQSGPTSTTPVAPTHGGGTPVSNGITTPTGGFPPGGVPGPGGLGKTPTAPPKIPATPPSQARNTVAPRSGTPATRTPGLPTNRAGSTGRPGVGNPNGRTTGTNGTRNRWAGRGLQKSQMAPVNRVGQPRKAGEVMGRRAATKPAASNASKPTPRRVQSTVIRGANKSGGKISGRKSPVDNTKRGFTSRVINPRDRIAEAKGHSRTPFVGNKMKHPANPEPFGKRPEPETARSAMRREIDEFREKRRKQLKQSDGLSRPVIDNGLTNSAQIDHAIPTPREAVKAEDGFWQLPKDLVPGVIGKRDWSPETFNHDPGPVFSPRQAHYDDLDARLSRLSDPGPTAFDPKRRPDTTNWPGSG